jgi:type III pantothenate kinase
MLCAVDIGNTNIVVALHSGSSWVETWRIHTDSNKTTDEYFVVLESLLTHSKHHPLDHIVNRAIISSVVPNLSRALQKNIIRLFGINPIMVNKSRETGLLRATIPSELGTDLICNMAWAHYRKPNLPVAIIDFGTAMTISVVDSSGGVIGVSIAPGLLTSVNALFGRTAQLPQVELKIPKAAIGRNTEESIRSGIMFGYAGMVESMIAKIEEQLGVKLYVMATGGLCSTISPLIPRIDEIDSFHTLNGLKLISDLNQNEVKQ